MMEQLVNEVAQRTGISPDKARGAVDTVVGYLKDRLPGPIASQLDRAASGDQAGEGDDGDGLTGAAKGLFGGRNQADS